MVLRKFVHAVLVDSVHLDLLLNLYRFAHFRVHGYISLIQLFKDKVHKAEFDDSLSGNILT